MSEGSVIGRGVRQGCPLSPTLFNICLEELVKNMEGVVVGGRRMKCIRFADDTALLAEEKMILRDMLLELNDCCEEYGVKINTNKTKNMVIERKIKKRCITYEVEKLPSKFGVHSEEYVPIRTVTPVVAGM
ncbi:hypothetical protein ANN_11126 [Periplaneta americana]|uniref:Reverse transcriptase domain-containing protein n=1 Tax=Periplaneta americana TaxID=6978 RepID=A0ABQ8T5T3_PERAM|nr:hypothetical protein ANN_11126 [Periplaneta americana]